MKKDYNKGLASGIRLSEDIVKNNTDAVDKMTGKLDNLNKDVKDMGDTFGNYMDARDNAEIQRLLNIITKTSLDDLEDNEKLILANILSSTAMQYGTNDPQKLFLKTFLKAAGVSMEDVLTTGFNGTALADAVDSLSVIRYMYQILNDFLYLADNTVDFDDTYNAVLTWFGGIVNEAEAKEITQLKVTLYGEDILIEQFTKGFSISNEDDDDNAQASILPVDDKTPYKEIYLPCAKEYLNSNASEYIETKNYLVICPDYFNPALEIIDKETHERKKLEEINNKFEKKERSYLWDEKRLCSINDTLIYIRGTNIVLYDLKSSTETILPDSTLSNLDVSDIKHLAVSGDNLIYVTSGTHYGDKATYVYSLTDKKEYRLENGERNDVVFTVANNKVYSVSILSKYLDEDDDDPYVYPSLSVFDLETKTMEDVSDINTDLYDIKANALSFDSITVVDNTLYFICATEDHLSYNLAEEFSLVKVSLDSRIALEEDCISLQKNENSISAIKYPFIINNYALFVDRNGSSWDLKCYDIVNDESRTLYPYFTNSKTYESGILFKTYETETELKPYSMCGYWIMYSNDSGIFSKKNNWICKDIRETWDTEE